jgi:hypothetical protein
MLTTSPSSAVPHSVTGRPRWMTIPSEITAGSFTLASALFIPRQSAIATAIITFFFVKFFILFYLYVYNLIYNVL